MRITERRLRSIIRRIIKENEEKTVYDIIESVLKKADNTVINVTELIYQLISECESKLLFKVDESLIDNLHEEMSELIHPHVHYDIDENIHWETLEYFDGDAVMLDINVREFDNLVNNLEKIMSASSLGHQLKHGADESGMGFADRIKKELGAEYSDNIDNLIDTVYEDMYIQDVKDGKSHQEAYEDALNYIKSFYDFGN